MNDMKRNCLVSGKVQKKVALIYKMNGLLEG